MAEVPQSYLEDASGLTGRAEEFAAPSTAEELASLMAGCRRRGLPVTLSGAGTGVTGGRVPQGGMIVSLERFRRLEIHNGFAIAGAGVSLKDVHEAAQAAGQFYPPDPTEWSASIGGTIATNASGSRSFHYGSTRKWVRLVKAVLADGTVRTFHRGDQVDFPFTPRPAPRARKHTAGYPLRQGMDWIDLLCGSEGTLAAVVEAELYFCVSPANSFPGSSSSHRPPARSAPLNWRAIPQLRMLEYFDAVQSSSSAAATPRFQPRPARRCSSSSSWILSQATLVETGSNASTLPAPSANSLVRRNGPGRLSASALPPRPGRLVNEGVRATLPELNSTSSPGRGQRRMMRFYRPAIDENLTGRYVIFATSATPMSTSTSYRKSEQVADTGAR